jgi:hypothetical protein
MFSVLIKVDVTVEKNEDAEDIGRDLHEFLNNNAIINSVNVTDEISY